jgi:hypothetical protein
MRSPIVRTKPLLTVFVMAVVACVVMHRAAACTIFVLTDAKRTLFCNNEDWSNPKTRIWFVPAGKGYLGCAYVGFDDGVEQGGVNTKGLAFDAVAVYNEDWKADPNLRMARGNPLARMLETCATVEEAFAYIHNIRFPWFSAIKILVADKSGSVRAPSRNDDLPLRRFLNWGTIARHNPFSPKLGGMGSEWGARRRLESAIGRGAGGAAQSI